MRFPGALTALLLFCPLAWAGEPLSDEPAQETKEPFSSASFLTKLTVSAYFVGKDKNLDLNLRHTFGAVVAWAGYYLDTGGPPQGRLGGEYDAQWGILSLVPTIQLGTNGLVAGSIYSELGGKAFLIGGFSRTNLKPFYNLSFDPNESIQAGGGVRLSGQDRLSAFIIFDDRLSTGQQDTHVVLRHHLGKSSRLTLDGIFKSGHTDDGRFVRALGWIVSFQRGRYFSRVAWDPYVNFTEDRMIRVGGGLRF